MEVIPKDLHCNAVRITGGDPTRLELAAGLAADAGLVNFTKSQGLDERRR
jgi:hypothetical protein